MRIRAEKLLKKMLGADARFREGQWDAIRSIVVDKERTLVVQRTGWGKSLVYFIATRILRDEGNGITLLVSPLLSLMRNQIDMAEKIGIRAVSITSENIGDWEHISDGLKKDQYDILMISPERLASKEFNDFLAELPGNIGMLVIDEAHCISDWGHDFRPDYRRITTILNHLPDGIPVLATTATANDRVVTDIKEQIENDLNIIRGPLARKTLRIQSIMLRDQAERLAWLTENIPRLPGSGIIYCLTKYDCRRVATWLQSCGIDALEYHSSIPNEDKVLKEQLLINNQTKALVATVALGMGFDKPDLGFVIHYQRPGSVVAYYQQIGRAGRGIEDAYAILLNGKEDDEIQDYFISRAFPDASVMLEVLETIEDADSGLSIPEILRRINVSKGNIEKCIKILEIEGAVFKEKSKYYRSVNPWVPDAERMTRVTQLRYHELEMMQEFAKTDQCYMQRVGQELDDPYAAPCGKCANCKGLLLPTEVDPNLIQKAINFLRRDYLVIEPRKQWPAYGIGHFRGKIDTDLQNRPGIALCLYGDAGWGSMVRKGKYEDNRFSDDLINAAADYLKREWMPDSMPEWVAAVPSKRRPELVADLAVRIADKLGIQFCDVLIKIKDAPEQKMMANSAAQAGNVFDAFAVKGDCPAGAVLLVDDVVDSRWTLTVCGVMLREAGSGPVFPLALAASWSGGDDN